MKESLKEIIVLLCQLILFYVLPMMAGPTDMMGVVLLLILGTCILSLILTVISEKKIKYLYPVVVAILFCPSILIYYNSSACVHILWYLIVSLIGMIIGIGIRKLINWGKYEN